MTKMEILVLEGLADRLAARQKEPKPDWMSADMHLGKKEGWAEGEREVRSVIKAAEK